MTTLYDVARREAEKVAPTLTDDQLPARILIAKTIVGSSTKGGQRHTLGRAALDVFREEAERRRDTCEHGIVFGVLCPECRALGIEP